MIIAVKLAKIGLTMETGIIRQWLKAEGDFVEQDDPLLEVETDKSVNTVESFYTGYLKKIVVPEGAEVPVETIIAYIGDKDDEVPAEVEMDNREPQIPQAQDTQSLAEKSGPAPAGRTNASPLARRLAAEKGIDLSTVKGTGPGGRIGREDVLAAAAASPADDENKPFPGAGVEAEELPLSGLRKLVAERTKASYLDAPHIYLEVSVDASEMERLRTKLNAENNKDNHLTVTDFLVRAVAIALQNNPRLNAAIQGDTVRLFKAVNVGIAVSTRDGLVVPVIKECDRLSLADIAARRKELVDRARAGRQTMEDLSAGTFTVTNLGMFGVDSFQPILNPGQTAILAVGAISRVPIIGESGEVQTASLMKFTLACDHRVVDGAEGARFLAEVKSLLEQTREWATGV